MPAKGEVRGIEKFEAKLAAKEKRDSKKRQRLAVMTPEQRERHLRWHETHPPGGPGERARRRQQLETRALIEGLIGKAKPEVDIFQ